MTDEFTKIERDAAGNVKGLIALDPSEVTVVLSLDGSIRGYLWRPADPVEPLRFVDRVDAEEVKMQPVPRRRWFRRLR